VGKIKVSKACRQILLNDFCMGYCFLECQVLLEERNNMIAVLDSKAMIATCEYSQMSL
jgi:hypothetical protein